MRAGNGVEREDLPLQSFRRTTGFGGFRSRTLLVGRWPGRVGSSAGRLSRPPLGFPIGDQEITGAARGSRPRPSSRGRSPGMRFPRPAARLASLHRRGLLAGCVDPAMALLGFRSRRLRCGRGSPSPIGRRPSPPVRSARRFPAGRPAGTSAGAGPASLRRRARRPFRALAPGRMGPGFPAPALLWFDAWSALQSRSAASASGPRSPARSVSMSWSSPVGCLRAREAQRPPRAARLGATRGGRSRRLS